MTIRTALLLALLATATLSAQSPGPDFVLMPNGGYLHKTHPAAQAYLATLAPSVPTPETPAPPSTPIPTPIPHDVSEPCDYVSPYLDRPACVVGDYRIGRLYQFGASQGVVIGLSMASHGGEVVTVQWVYADPHIPGVEVPIQVWAFRNDGSPRPWEMRKP